MSDYPTPPSPTDAFRLHEDGGLIYNPIEREAVRCGTDHLYDSVPRTTHKLTLGNLSWTVDVPATVRAYDAVPLFYTLDNPDRKSEIHLGATTFEDPFRASENEYDLTLPGKLDLDVTFLNTLSGYSEPDNRPILSADCRQDRPGQAYPAYRFTPRRRSATFCPGDRTWFRFRLTNTGNTVLDGDGNGTWCIQPRLWRLQDGEWQLWGVPENIWYRIVDELYPGESFELDICFLGHQGGRMKRFRIEPGEYKITIEGIVRNETDHPENYGKNIWGGEVYTCSTQYLTATETEEPVREPAPIEKAPFHPATRNKWLHTYQEFMSSYDTWLKPGEASERGVLWIQAAPWNSRLTLRLIEGDTDRAAMESIPLEVESDSLKVRFNFDNHNMTRLPDGSLFPAMMAQSMADMRANLHLGPDAQRNVIGTLRGMQECGINVITTTAAFEFDGSHGQNAADNIDAFWFSADAMRGMKLAMEGWVTYPFHSEGNLQKAAYYEPETMAQYKDAPMADRLAAAAGVKSAYQYRRWGDLFWRGANGETVLSVEDTRGWMRIDFNARLRMEEAETEAFRSAMKEKYGTIEVLNTAWGSAYASFEDIVPEEGTTDDHGWRSYKADGCAFREWSAALRDLDVFRTQKRVDEYKLVRRLLDERGVPDAKFNLRTEGGNWSVPEDETSTNSHYRHVLYSARRNSMIASILAESGLVYAHSDYTTLPFTPSEVADLTKKSVALGIVPAHLPQFNRMRDIAVNEKWGNDFTVDYNLSGPATQGAYINTITPVYTWFKAVYENGGVPGILWQDYLCDGYATATQRREIAFFTQKLALALCEAKETQPEKFKAWENAYHPPKASGLLSFKPSVTDTALSRCKETI